MTRFYFNTEYKVVGWLSVRRGEYLQVMTKNGPRVWWDRLAKEIDKAEYNRCYNAKVPHNKPRYYIKKWKIECK